MQRKVFSNGILTAVIVLGVAAGAQAKDHTPMTDQQIQTKIEHDLLAKDLVNVKVQVKDGIATLTGNVPSFGDKEEAGHVAGQLRDVSSVVNDIQVEQGANDADILQQLSSRINGYVFYTIYDIVQARVQDGVVTLKGEVTAPYKAQEIARMASKVQGVQKVENDIQVLPASMDDEHLRYEIASRIYGDSVFSDYAFEAHPPIHIIVDHGHVTLYGSVASRVGYRVAENIARSTFGVFSVKNELQIES
jgi:hyperosmotically inducible protein